MISGLKEEIVDFCVIDMIKIYQEFKWLYNKKKEVRDWP